MDYGKKPYDTTSKNYVDYMSEITDQYVKSIGGVHPADFKRPYTYEDYYSMQYLYDSPTKYLGGAPASLSDLGLVSAESEKPVIPQRPLPLTDFQGTINADNCLVYFNVSGGNWVLGGVPQIALGSYPYWPIIKFGSGIRFFNVTIRQGVSIASAYFTVTAQLNCVGTVNSVIGGDLEDNAAPFSIIADYQSRCGTICGGADNNKRTTANVAWNGINSWVSGVKYQSPEIKTVIQEIVNRPGWVAGNSLALFWEDHADNSVGNIDVHNIGYGEDTIENRPTLHIEV